jgi:hypothetical protein
MEIICVVETLRPAKGYFFLPIFMENIITVDFFKKITINVIIGT